MMACRTLFVIILLSCTGCGEGPQAPFADLHQVKGTLRREMTPVGGGVVQFVADPPLPGFLVNGEVQSDGQFQLSTVRTTDSRGERRSGAPAGKYRVTYLPNFADQATAGRQEPVTLPELVSVEAKTNDLNLKLPAIVGR